MTHALIGSILRHFLMWIIAPCKFFTWILIIYTVEQGWSKRNIEIALTVHQGRQKCAVDCGDFVTRHDCCSTTMYFKSVSLHSGPIDEPVLAIDAHVSIAGCAACLEIDTENLRRMFLL